VKPVLVLLPRRDYDPTEVAVPWQRLADAGWPVQFATPDGESAPADEIMVSGRGLDPWARVALLKRLVLAGRLLRANRAARDAYQALARSREFRTPLAWDALAVESFSALVIPGGHRARGMREYLESPVLQRLVARFFEADRPVAAICHGVLLAARSISPSTQRSVLHGRRTTALTWKLERSAWQLARLTRYWDPDYYRTYPDGDAPAGFMSVEAEVTRALERPADFVDVPPGHAHYARKTSGLARDTASDSTPAWVVVDGNYVSARWPGDANTFAARLIDLLEAHAQAAGGYDVLIEPGSRK
jgi:putative intracellular protease/amidase